MFLFLACQSSDQNNTPDSLEQELSIPPVFWEKQTPTLRLMDSAPKNITLAFDGGGARVGLQSTHDRLFSTLDCPDCGWTNELGKPRLPVIRRFVEVEPGSQLSSSFEAADRNVIRLEAIGAKHLILPVQRPVEKKPGAAKNTPFEMDEELYADDAFYPQDDVQISGPFVMRGHWLYLVEVHPFRYNPYKAELSAPSTATLNLLSKGESLPAQIEARDASFSPAFDRWMSSKVLNHQPRTLFRGLSTDKYAEGMIFVVGDAYINNANLQNYIATREAEGHKVVTVTMSDIGSSANDLRAYVQAEYQSWTEPALSYVVLVGDVDDVPTYNGSGGGNSQATDLYYASIDPGSYTSDILAPDLMLSRISVNNDMELNTYVNRALAYVYADFPTDTSWMRKFTFAASCDNSNISEGTHDYVIDNYTAPAGYTGTQPSNPMAGGDQLYCAQGNAGEADIQAALNDGRLVINFSGHGGEEYWADPAFDDLSGVTPPDAAPFVISNACLTGSYDYSSDCWGEQWLAHAHGAILFWGGSNSTYWDEDDILEKRMWDGVFLDDITHFAGITRNALLATLLHYGPVENMEYYFEIYNLLGDSSIDLYTDIPYDATITYPSELPIGLDQIDFSVTNAGTAVEGALVSVLGGQVRQVGRTDAAGQVTLQLNPPPDTPGDLQVVVTGHNLRRHEGSILVISANGPYLSHDDHEITSDGSTFITPNPGRHVVMPISVRNVGSDPAIGASGILVCESAGLATVTQDSVLFPDAAPDQTVRSTTHAEFDISDDVPDGARINFRLDWSTSGGDSGITRFGVTVLRPLLVYQSHTVDDALSGCDTDGIADMAEPTDFELTIVNQGSGDASQVSLNLLAPDCAVSGPVAIDSIPAGGQTTAVFTVTAATSIVCPAPDVLFTLYAGADELPLPDESSFTELLNADIEAGTYSDDMEGTEPNGWTHQANVGNDDWRYTSADSHSPDHSWFASDAAYEKDISLFTPSQSIGDTALLTFWQKYDFENGYDGGVLEISVDGGNQFSDLGSYITQNGYNSALDDWTSNPLGAREAWSGSANWQMVTADLSQFGPGDIILRFRLGCDSSVGGVGWWIDDLELNADTVVCNVAPCGSPNDPPVADAGPDQELTEDDPVQLDGSGSSDPNGNPLRYTWTQTAGATVTLSNTELMNPTFTPPNVAVSTVLTFELVVQDWQLPSPADSVDITITPVNHPPTADAGADRQVDEITTVGLDASGSSDPDEDNLSFAWSQTSGPSVVLSDAQASNPSFTAPDVQGLIPLVFELLVSDGSLSDTDTVTISVWGECDDGLECTDDHFNGSECEYVPTDCDDGDPCTADTCTDEEGCHYEPLGDCSLCGSDGLCMAGACIAGAQDIQTACDDGDACTATDICDAGACVGQDPVICEAENDCHEVGTCDPNTGTCSNPLAEDGITCDDGNLCTQTDACDAGTCIGQDPVHCQAIDDCHEAGFCDSTTGECSNPLSADGTTCDDGDGCTQEGTCTAGLCEGGAAVVCEAIDECHLAGVCEAGTGECTNPPAEDGTECAEGKCKEGVCTPESSGCGCATSSNSNWGFSFGLFLLGLFRFSSVRGRRRK
ncbi:MAG: hypothetical protein JRF33_08035 [Deltaproteobacteria bacterium]|nr:hypothetical protein [Deltaproteobacteria bacterium]